ncbi:hypothetical protein [Sphingomonas aracearum]|uniref:hypothetical protein n=1 Tax=Sphingomonas aracearum TaxID=2283317 RepID=UPI0015F01228|nr:hypothetical protein [Sphingomonas aracearum]
MTSKVKKGLQTVAHYAKIIWSVPAVQSVILTRLIQTGIGASGAGIVVAIFDALVKQ